MDGTLEQTEGAWRLRFERRLDHPPEKVWRAITEPEHLAAWFPGGRFDGEVLEREEGSLLAFRWGTDVVRLELRPEGDGTRLVLLDTIDQLGKAARDAAGWHVCLDQLAAHLDDAALAGTQSDRWRAVHPGYVGAFGPEAATIGPPDGAL